MKGYIAKICISAIIAAITDILAPKEHQKYIRVLLGFLIIYVILSPIPSIKKVRFAPIESEVSSNMEIFEDSISKKLRENIETDIAERMKGEFGIICTAEVVLEIDDEHKIRGVREIMLSKKIPEGAEKRLKEVYGCDRIEYQVK